GGDERDQPGRARERLERRGAERAAGREPPERRGQDAAPDQPRRERRGEAERRGEGRRGAQVDARGGAPEEAALGVEEDERDEPVERVVERRRGGELA